MILILAVALRAESLPEDLCPFGDNDVVEIPLSFQFVSEAFQTSWAYRGLEPAIEFSSGLTLKTPEREVVTGGRLELAFCVSKSFVPAQGSFVFHIGPRLLNTAIRPVTWRKQKVTIQGRTTTVDRGRMVPIDFLQPDPDWVIVRRAAWLQTEKGPQLEIVIVNPSKTSHAGVELHFRATNKPLLHVGAPRTAKVLVRFKQDKRGVKVASADPQFPELVSREATLDRGPSGEILFRTDLGQTGALANEDTLTIRYVFEEGDARQPRDPPAALLKAIYALQYRDIEISGERAFPRFMHAEDKP